MMAEYDVEMSRDSSSRNKNMILDDTAWGSMVEPATGSGTFEVGS